MGGIAARYAPMIAAAAALYADDNVVSAQLRSLRVTREEWDEGRGGGHFWFDLTAPSADREFAVSLCANDIDGGYVDVIIHSAQGMLDWGEWFRYDGLPVLAWPLERVRRFTQAPPHSGGA